MGDQWLRDFEKARKNVQQLTREVDSKDCGKLEAKQAALIRGQMSRVRQDVSHLEKTLMAISENLQAHNVTRNELSRRGDLMKQLSGTVDGLQESIRTGARRRVESSLPDDSRDGGHHGHSSGSATWRREGREARPEGGNLQQETLQQDDCLDFLHGAIGNLKNIGGSISQEVDLHCRLLGDLEEQTDKASDQVKKHQGQLLRLMEQSTTCQLWSCIFVLLLILFVLLFFF